MKESKKRILFVDDEPNVLQGLQRALRRQADAWDMTFATGPVEATELLAQNCYDAIVLDVKLPGKSGLELLAEIKADSRSQDTEVVMLTGLQDQSLKRQVIDLGATDLLNKPVLKEDLVARLNSALRTKTYHDELHARNATLEQQSLQSQKMELIGILASGVKHYLNGILSIIVIDSEFIAQFLTDDQEVQENVKNIKAAGQHARRILKQIRKFSRHTETEHELFSLGPVIDECLELLQFYIPEGIAIKWDGPLTSRLIRADANQMYQMLMNLCVNAAHAMENEGVLKISLTETQLNADVLPPGRKDEFRPGLYVKLEVSDTGAGMDQATLERIFEPLSITMETQEEVGLGLSAVQRIIKDHGGLITIESIPAEKTTFSVYLPCA